MASGNGIAQRSHCFFKLCFSRKPCSETSAAWVRLGRHLVIGLPVCASVPAGRAQPLFPGTPSLHFSCSSRGGLWGVAPGTLPCSLTSGSRLVTSLGPLASARRSRTGLILGVRRPPAPQGAPGLQRRCSHLSKPRFWRASAGFVPRGSVPSVQPQGEGTVPERGGRTALKRWRLLRLHPPPWYLPAVRAAACTTSGVALRCPSA